MLERGKYKAQRPPSQFRSQSTGGRLDIKQPTSSNNLWRERQERDYRKAHGLCYSCVEKYEHGHAEKCSKRPKQQLNSLVVNDLDVNLTEEVLNQLAMEDSLQEEFGQLSLHTLLAADHSDCIKLRALVQNKVMLLLVDSGLTVVPASPKQVKLPNGQVLLSDQIVPQLSWWCQGHTINTDMRVLDLEVYDGILGFDWLKKS